MKYIIKFVIIFIALCAVKMNSQTIPANLSLSGLETVENQYNAGNIQSTQTVNSGTTTYRASNVIVLKPGFHAKSESDFRASIDDFSNRLNMMTYNIWRKSNKFAEHAQVITQSNADIIAIQEIKGASNFKKLKKDTNLDGEMCATEGKMGWLIDWMKADYGICVFWKPSLGTPIITKKTIKSSSKDADKRRAYIIAEFDEFCFISTHYSLDSNDRITMTNAILSESVVINCINTNKPVYIAGDMNEQPGDTAINIFENANFVVLNDTSNSNHFTDPDREKHIDLILEHNVNPSRELIWRGIPDGADWSYTVSDHLPYLIKLNYK